MVDDLGEGIQATLLLLIACGIAAAVFYGARALLGRAQRPVEATIFMALGLAAAGFVVYYGLEEESPIPAILVGAPVVIAMIHRWMRPRGPITGKRLLGVGLGLIALLFGYGVYIDWQEGTPYAINLFGDPEIADWMAYQFGTLMASLALAFLVSQILRRTALRRTPGLWRTLGSDVLALLVLTILVGLPAIREGDPSSFWGTLPFYLAATAILIGCDLWGERRRSRKVAPAP